MLTDGAAGYRTAGSVTRLNVKLVCHCQIISARTKAPGSNFAPQICSSRAAPAIRRVHLHSVFADEYSSRHRNDAMFFRTEWSTP